MAGLWSLCSLSSAVWQAVKPPEGGDVQISRKYPLPVFQGAADRSYQRRRFHRKRYDEADKRRTDAAFFPHAYHTYRGGAHGGDTRRNIAGRPHGQALRPCTRKELKDVLPKKADFAHLEKILFNASKPNGKKELSGKELGIPSLEKGRIELSAFPIIRFR